MNARRGWVRAQERGRVAVARELAKDANDGPKGPFAVAPPPPHPQEMRD